MADQKIKLEQNSFDKAFRVKWTGGHSIAVILILLTIMMNTCAVEHHLNKSNELRKLQLDQAKRQFSLDSLRFEYAKQHQK